MRNLVLIAGLGMALAGCNKGPSTEETAKATGEIRLENASAEEVMKQAAAAQDKNQIKPGEWENTVHLISAEMPGAPEMLRKQMEAETKKPPEAKKECKRAEDVKAVDFSKLAPQAQGCVFPTYVIAGGRIDATMECKSPAGPVKMTIHGTQTSTAYDITMTQEQSIPGAPGPSKMTIKATGKRLGDCQS